MEELRIDPELQGMLPPLTDEEFSLLRDNILRDGKVIKPLIVWDGMILDGHHRYKIIQDYPEIPYTVENMEFPDKWAAIDWMIDHQRGQRNMTEAQKAYALGKQYEARKHTHGGNRRSSDFSSDQSGHLKKMRIREQLAKEQKVGSGTVMRAQEFAHGIDTIRETSPETADAILTGRLTPKKQDVAMVGKANEKDRAEMIRQVAENKRVTPVSVPEKIEAEKPKAIQYGPTKERETHNRIVEAIETLYDDKPIKFTINDLYDEIRWNAESYIRLLSHTLEDHGQLIKAYKEEVKAYIAENVTMKIKEIEEAL